METLRQWLVPSDPNEPSQDESTTREAPYLVSGSWGLSLFSHIRSILWTDALVQRGYEQHRDDMFKMPFLGSWATVVSGKYVEEIARAPDSYLSFQEIANDQLQLEHLVGPELSRDHIHLALIRTLNRNLKGVYDEIADETEYSISSALKKGKDENDWTSVNVNQWVGDVVFGLNQRIFVGLPLCRDEEWAKAGQSEDTAMVLRAYLLKIFPKSKRGDVQQYISRFTSSMSVAREMLTKAIKERMAMTEEDRPNDMLSWTISRAPGEEPDLKIICGILGLLSLVAQGTTSMSFGHALLYLVAHPEHASILHEDILQAMDGGDLTYQSLERMHKLDSFLRETQRLSTISNVSLGRIVMQDFTFSNGVRVPAGEMIQAVATGVHRDPAYYSDPLEFKPWRFYELAQAETLSTDRAATKYNMVGTSTTYLTWGLGKHACPGRWYATMIMKHLMAYLILHYDFKLPDSANGQRPADWNLTGACIPNTKANILLRRKEDNTIN
ncbi:hypothetical protein M408DRAFT_333196 [Serendipita vermifera MAFF 305830]|uniref:Cytochrome P450 n=1 Tax=Serendipita vermifera MAFF 305830 TaxID=933852 RepID=A0A0C3AB37_SERVB|nr:hypothetical protein M408DRAFT_333196 [Serendipita vermifera MAFF 305830]